MRQRYERLDDDVARGLGDSWVTQCYRFEDLATGFQGTIWTDADGFVLRHDGLFELLPDEE